MKFTPELEFAEDPGATGGERVEELLRQIQVNQAATGNAPGAEGEAT
jgi:ribosome-binding factor A